MNWLTANNTKLKKSGILAFGIPAFKSAQGHRICPNAWDCIKGCYAKHGTFKWPAVAKAYERRYRFTKHKDFVKTLVAEIQRRKPKYVRIHDSGDFYDHIYLGKWMMIIKSCPQTTFYAYTKMVCMLKYYNGTEGFPANFKVIFSEGGKEDGQITGLDRQARIFPDLKSLQAAGYEDCHLDDLKALGGNIKVGLIYHGAKARAFKTSV